VRLRTCVGWDDFELVDESVTASKRERTRFLTDSAFSEAAEREPTCTSGVNAMSIVHGHHSIGPVDSYPDTAVGSLIDHDVQRLLRGPARDRLYKHRSM
jgi:hypothetical protein